MLVKCRYVVTIKRAHIIAKPQNTPEGIHCARIRPAVSRLDSYSLK